MEAKIQSECIIWCWNTYPQTRGLLFHVPNEGAKISTVVIKEIALFILSNITNHSAVLTKARQLLKMSTEGNAVGGAQAKAMGTISGVSDLIFLWNQTAYLIEMKDTKGRQSEHQIKWESLVVKNGYEYFICRNLSEFQSTINIIMSSNGLQI